ncbi:hypothetical protein BH11MYX3_BH11MYX3_07710 [soil metagenome]
MSRALVLVLLLAGCPGSKSPGGAGELGFRVYYPDAGAQGLSARIGKRMQAKPAAACNYPDGREARWANTGASVEQGALPPGLVLEDGAIGGVPTAAATAELTIKFAGVTCAGKPQGDQHVPVTITVR